jgi:hypothetical protein
MSKRGRPIILGSDRFYQPHPKTTPKAQPKAFPKAQPRVFPKAQPKGFPKAQLKPITRFAREPEKWIPPSMDQLFLDYGTENYRRQPSDENEVLVSFGAFMKNSFRHQLSVLRNPEDVDDIILTLYNTILLPQYITYERNYNFSRDPLGWKKRPEFQKHIKEMWRGMTRKNTRLFAELEEPLMELIKFYHQVHYGDFNTSYSGNVMRRETFFPKRNYLGLVPVDPSVGLIPVSNTQFGGII